MKVSELIVPFNKHEQIEVVDGEVNILAKCEIRELPAETLDREIFSASVSYDDYNDYTCLFVLVK